MPVSEDHRLQDHIMPDLRAPADERMAFPKAIRRLFQLRRASHRAGQGAAFC